MELFPFGYPWPTAMYLTLYVGTLVLHVVLMNYVIAGTSVLAWTALTQRQAKTVGVVEYLLRDWMPFALGGAITAGVAPLLFVQILYQDRFYTANLLLFHRWMLILPVLILGFYALYLLKSHWLAGQNSGVKKLVSVLALSSFLFVGYSWSENHLLSCAPQSVWIQFFKSARTFYFEPSLIPRLCVWFLGAFPTLWLFVGWQLRRVEVQQEGGAGAPTIPQPLTESPSNVSDFGQAASSVVATQATIHGLAVGALISISLTALAAAVYVLVLPTPTRGSLFSISASPYFAAAGLGLGIQFWGWCSVHQRATLRQGSLIWITGGLLLTLVSTGMLREVIRLSAFEIQALFGRHAKSAEAGGMWVFLIFLIVNGLIVAWCLRGIAADHKIPQ